MRKNDVIERIFVKIRFQCVANKVPCKPVLTNDSNVLRSYETWYVASEEPTELVGMLAKALKSKYDNTIDLFNHISLNVFL